MVESLLSLESVSRIYGTDVEVHALHQVSTLGSLDRQKRLNCF